MPPGADYRRDVTYLPTVHRELSVAWLRQALLLGGQHQGDFGTGPFHWLEIGCGAGLNLIFNAAAHPEAHFYGIDLHPSHVAEAEALARQLDLANVSFAVADLTSFRQGRPPSGPARLWPEQFDAVVAHGVASWVGPETRQALLEAAAAVLRPGGVFFCSYNTYPGWLGRSALNMLALEQAQRTGGQTSQAGLLASARLLEALLGEAEKPLPLGRALPQLRADLGGLEHQPVSYLLGEYHSCHQPLYVGPMHRQAAGCGLHWIGSATLPELFPQLLDPQRRELVLAAADAELREVLLDLAIHQSFRRDLFAYGRRPLPATEHRRRLEPVLLMQVGADLAGFTEVPTSLGQMGLEPEFCGRLQQLLGAGPVPLAVVASELGEDLLALLPWLALLITAEAVALTMPGEEEGKAAFNRQLLERITAGAPIDALLSPVLGQPVRITAVEAFLLQAWEQGIAAEEVPQLAMLGMGMAGAELRDAEGKPLEDPALAWEQLEEQWRTFAEKRLPVLRRLGVSYRPG
ncbi:MAG: class I SAM-dependent methyltransferase [Cyanobacteriota bacterium]|jgi:SAM-dependent methyltransferase